jgi:hypothetical protein
MRAWDIQLATKRHPSHNSLSRIDCAESPSLGCRRNVNWAMQVWRGLAGEDFFGESSKLIVLKKGTLKLESSSSNLSIHRKLCKPIKI